MSSEQEEKRYVSTNLDLVMHRVTKYLKRRYKTQGRVEKGRQVSVSDALRFFVEEHEPDLIEVAEKAIAADLEAEDMK